MEGNSRSLLYEDIVYKTNSYGIRNKEVSTTRDSNVIRILTLGDSFLWEDGLTENDLITTKLKEKLNDKFTDSIEVINAGIGGFNTKDEWKSV